MPVCRPLMVHSVSPWRARKIRGAAIVLLGGGKAKEGGYVGRGHGGLARISLIEPQVL